MKIKKLILVVFLFTFALSENLFAKALPPGTGQGDVPANVLILLDKSGSMGWRMGGGTSGMKYPYDADADSNGDILVSQYQYDGVKKFVYDTATENNCKVIKMPGEWVVKYDKDKEKNVRYNIMYNEAFDKDYMILGNQVNEDIKIVHFANFDNTIHEHPEKWIKEYWK